MGEREGGVGVGGQVWWGKKERGRKGEERGRKGEMEERGREFD